MIFCVNFGNPCNTWHEMRNFAIFYCENVSNFKIEFSKNDYKYLGIFAMDKNKRISSYCWIQGKNVYH